MITMTTRSSRFFVVLVHLVGVSTHVPSWKSGIVGVNPLSIVLETLDASSLAPDYFHAQDSTTVSDKKIQQLQGQPHWLQDVLGDQTCLDPMGGFSECGDATLWMLIPKRSSRQQARWRKWITWATEEPETEENTSNSRIQGYALQVYDDSHQRQTQTPQPSSAKQSNGLGDFVSSIASSSYVSTYNSYHSMSVSEELAQKECLTRRRKDNQLVLVPCSEDRAWAWHFNEHGVLYFKKLKGKSPLGGSQDSTDSKREKQKRLQKKFGKKTLECLGRNASHSAILMPCSGSLVPSIPEAIEGPERVLQIGLVRQVTAESILGVDADASEMDEPPDDNKESIRQPDRFPPSPFDIAHSHASITGRHVGSKSTSLPSKFSSKASSASSDPAPILPLMYFKDTNPILLATGHVGSGGDGSKPSDQMKNEKPAMLGKSDKKSTSSMVGRSSTSSSTATGPSSSRAKPSIRKIQTNPYITESKDELWTDPQTGLVYHTDLCRYLGHDRKEVGRHTITGVGQYMKTVFNIKVYGIAFYVSKRDLLADPVMEQYASMTTEELRQQSDFYETLRFMAPSTNPLAGNFDRTLFLKTNMQLATDTMRSSLDADWKMLTQEAKDLLIGSSMKARPASEKMMEAIQSPDNPSKCSCAQVAPEEYGIDPACCARGTELVFTWRKSGSLEVRLNGDLVDSFDRPDIAAAIFYEYLRQDEPMSFDFLDHVVDGFPMLLGPLSQVKGVGSPGVGQNNPSMATTATNASGGHNNFFTKTYEGVGDVLSSTASSVAGMVHHGATELGAGAMSAARSMGDAARNIGEDVERRRGLIGKHVSHFAHQTIASFYSGSKDQKVVAALPSWLESMSFDIPLDELDGSSSTSTQSRRRRRLFQNSRLLTKLFGNSDGASTAAPDEIVPMIHPVANATTQQLFLGMVHMYLLLILIVSFPANLTTRTKMVLTKKSSKLSGAVQAISDSDSEEGSSMAECEADDTKSSSRTKHNGINRGFPSFTKRPPYRSSNL